MIRIIDITYICLKYDLEDFLVSLKLNKFFQFGSKIKRLFYKKIDAPLEQRLRMALEELGPVYIKLGQIIATRKDLLPSRFSKELEQLRDNVKSEFIDINKILGQDIQDFDYINYTPIASASIAQVYQAQLKNQDVVIKVSRPNAEMIIRKDLAFFKSLLSKFSSNYKSNILKGMLSELENSLLQEIDFINEINNAEQFRKNMQDFPNVLIPKIYEKYSSKNIIVMERMYGTPIDQVDAIKSKGINLKDLSEEGVEILMIQILRNRFFHADLHAGNIWINDQGKRIFLDFGIMGSLSKHDRDILADMISNLYIKRYDKFIDLQIQAGWAPSDLDKEKFLESIKELTNNKKSFSILLNDLLILGESYGLIIPVQFLLLVKTLMVTEANAKNLNSSLDLATVATSILFKHFKDHIK